MTNWGALELEIYVTLVGIALLLADMFGKPGDRTRWGYAAAVGLLLVLLRAAMMHGHNTPEFFGMYRFDALAHVFKMLFLAATIIVLVMSVDFARQLQSGRAEFYALICFACVGMMVLASANDFVLLFVGLELVTISFYVLTSFQRARLPSIEAGTKYLILGALASGFTVYGISLVFGTTGTMNFGALAEKLHNDGVPAQAFVLGMLLVLAGLGFKIAAFPFQIWAPDVYQGAPTPVTAFLSVGSKAAGFVLLLRVLLGGLLPVYEKWAALIAILSGATILYGNLGAIPQRNIKRLLGYSSIGHAGYMLMGIAALNSLGAAAVVFYLVQYAFTVLAAFLVIVAVTNSTDDENIASFAGLHRRAPILAAAMLMAMLSLAGIPPLSGFFGKFLLFTAVIRTANIDPRYYALAAVGAAAVILSLYFYLGVVRAMFIDEADEQPPVWVSWPTRVALYVCMAAMIGLGIFQRPLMALAENAVKIFALQ
jgi:NADH-quinone oxidoreductase subunit N